MKLTKEEVCERFDVSESSLLTNFKRTQASILKKYGIKLTKNQDKTYNAMEDDKRAMSMFQEDNSPKVIGRASVKIMDFDFLTLLGILMTPLQVFRGSYEDFLSYLELKKTKDNLTQLKTSLAALAASDYISYVIDKTDENYFIAGLYRKTELELQVGINMVNLMRKLAKKYKKRSWLPLFKCWLGIQIMYEDQPYTVQDLCNVTGLTKYSVETCTKILEKENIIMTERAGWYKICLGKRVELNAIFLKQN